MALESLFIQALRIFDEVEITPSKINVLYGHNGSGKTSVLEAVYLLATGRSFRAQHQHVIQQNAPFCVVRGSISQPEYSGPSIKIAIQKNRQGAHVVKLAGQEVTQMAEIAKYLPVQVLHLLNYQILQAAPDARRKMLDWGVFHVEHSFLGQWRDFNQLLKQRNAALRLQHHPQAVWEQQLALVGEEIHRLRLAVCAGWFAHAQQWVEEFLGFAGIEMAYYPGWDTAYSLQEVFVQNLNRDFGLGYTYNGPQRADLQIKYKGKLAQHVLSQGQQKRLVAALQLSQIAWVYGQTGMRGVVLIDDLPAELDVKAQEQVMQVLLRMDLQVFLTCVEESLARRLGDMLEAKLFHVEHGIVKEIV